jgi:glucose/arabinose dehydrogenase
VDPHFADNGYIYVAYTTTDAHDQLSRLTVTDEGIDPNSEFSLFRITKGGNYGWPGAEGVCASCTSINPIYTYDHSAGSAAITSVLFYTGDVFGPSYHNKVFIADYIRGWIKVRGDV